MMTPSFLPILVTLKTRAVDMAQDLGSLTHFLEAAQALCTCRKIPPDLFQKNSRKIVVLIEIARKTLTIAGISLYSFATCSEALAPFKAAYTELLYMLKEHRHNIDATLNARVLSLLAPLRTSFVIQRKGEPSGITSIPRGFYQVPGIPPESRRLFPKPAETSDLMPPPDAFTGVNNLAPSLHKKSPPARRRIWGEEEARHALSRRRPHTPNADQENYPPTPPPRALARPMSRRFGIFCTGKSSMHQPLQDRGRPRTSWPAKEQ